jgi:ABC-type dipeptide/oligopeptide/nickel transport system permease component
VISTITCIVLGAIAARTRMRWLDSSISGGSLVFFSIPNFCLGLMLIWLVERVFSWPGMGLLMVDAINQKDNMVVLGVTIVMTVMILVANILTDIAYGLLDPRLRGRFTRSGGSQA